MCMQEKSAGDHAFTLALKLRQESTGPKQRVPVTAQNGDLSSQKCSFNDSQRLTNFLELQAAYKRTISQQV